MFSFKPAPSMDGLSIDPVGVTEYPLPSPMRSDYSWIARNPTFTFGEVQYAVWVDENRKARIARRVYRQGWSDSVDLSLASGTALSADFELDSHNTITVCVDGYGYIHIAGNHHVDPMRYMRSAKPGDIHGAWVQGMVGTEEQSVTYPEFIKAKSGNLYLYYRNRGVGGTSAANHYINKYNPVTQTWVRHVHFFQGTLTGGDVSCYPTNFIVDPNSGRWHVFWTVRLQNTGPEANENISYAYSDDEGATWRKSDDTLYTLPITRETSGVIVTHPASAVSPIMNPHHCGGAIGPDGIPRAVFIVGDAGSIYRYRHVWKNGTNWQYDTILPTTNAASRRPDFVCMADGRKWLIFATPGRGSNTLRRLDLDTNEEIVLRNVNMVAYETSMEYSLERDTVYVMAPYERASGSLTGDPADIANQPNVPVIAVR